MKFILMIIITSFYINHLIYSQIISLKLNTFNKNPYHPALFFHNNELLSSGITISTYYNESTYVIRDGEEKILIPSQITDNYTIDNHRYLLYETNLQLSHQLTIPIILMLKEYGNNVLSFSYHAKEEYKLIYSLYKNKHLKHLSFSFENMGIPNNAYFHMGGIPNNYQLYPYKGKIKIKEKLPTWGFYLTSIKYHNITFSLNIPCIIQSEVNKVFIS